MFKQARASDLDLAELGAKLKERKQELTGKSEEPRPKSRLTSLFSPAPAGA
jgi:hypothetical protein